MPSVVRGLAAAAPAFFDPNIRTDASVYDAEVVCPYPQFAEIRALDGRGVKSMLFHHPADLLNGSLQPVKAMMIIEDEGEKVAVARLRSASRRGHCR